MVHLRTVFELIFRNKTRSPVLHTSCRADRACKPCRIEYAKPNGVEVARGGAAHVKLPLFCVPSSVQPQFRGDPLLAAALTSTSNLQIFHQPPTHVFSTIPARQATARSCTIVTEHSTPLEKREETTLPQANVSASPPEERKANDGRFSRPSYERSKVASAAMEPLWA